MTTKTKKQVSSCHYVTDPEAIAPLLDLQRRIMEELRAQATPRFIVPRDRAYFQAHMASPHAVAVLRDEADHHAAQAIFRVSDKTLDDELGVAVLPSWQPQESLSVLQGALVGPAQRGRGYMKHIMAAWHEWAAAREIAHLAARTEVSHKASRAHFEKAGFTLVDTVADPRDKARVCVFHKRL